MMPLQRYNKGVLGGGASFYGNFLTDGTANTAPAQNLLLASAFIVQEPATSITTIQAEVQAGGAGSSFRIGIYQNVNFDFLYPGALIIGTDGGALTSTAAGVKTNTLTGVKLDAGLYWAAYVCTSATPPTMICVGLAANAAYLGVSSANVINTGLTVAFTFAALPAAYPAAATYTTTATQPRISMTFAS